jgi:iron(III) transport system permease protein
VSGAGWWRTFVRVTLPLVAPSAISVGLVIFMAALRDVSTVLLLATSETQPVSVLVLQFSVTGDLEAAAAAGLMLSLLVVALALVGKRIARSLSV